RAFRAADGGRRRSRAPSGGLARAPGADRSKHDASGAATPDLARRRARHPAAILSNAVAERRIAAILGFLARLRGRRGGCRGGLGALYRARTRTRSRARGRGGAGG